MPKYNESRKTDIKVLSRYEYAHRVELNNPLNGVPQVLFRTSWVDTDIRGRETQGEFYRTLQETYEGNVLGQSDYNTFLASAYSLFFHVAAKEDSDD